MNKILNEKPLSEIQAMRELEKQGDLRDQMAYLASVVRSAKGTSDITVMELTTMMAEIMNVFEQTTIELTTMMAEFMGGM